MSQRNFPYPGSPTNVPSSVTEPSIAFKKQVSSVMVSILLFFVLYVVLFLLALGLVAACIVGGISLIGALRGFYGLLIGIGLIGVGIMVMIFLVKFLFAVSKFDRSGIVEINESEQPKLFAFIRELTKETQTVFPKKIYLSADVNACVFYDSSFWSMFLPIKKNLQIGLGLVNSLNLSEFKAVMAHEFGHFSQRSMKLGSFVYQVNRVIYNMLYENNSYGNFLQSWANISGVFAIFASITVKIVQAIQWLLRQMYSLVNKNYMSLSREMEFHADAVAASVSGGNNLITALRRVEIADVSYQIVLTKYNELLKEKKLGKNLYPDQRVVLNQLAKENQLPIENGLPIVESKSFESQQFTRVNFKDQWASHPTIDERESFLKSLNVDMPADTQSAWTVFDSQETFQETLTNKLFDAVDQNELAKIEAKQFAEIYEKDENLYSLPEKYNGFFTGREITILNEGDLTPADHNTSTDFNSIFSTANAQLIKKINGANSDLELLKAIKDKQIETKSFDFEGKKYSELQAADLHQVIEKEKKNWEEELARLDREAVQYSLGEALRQSPEKAAQLKSRYIEYYNCRKESKEYLDQVNKMMEDLQPIYAGATQEIEIINQQIEHLKNESEPQFKKTLSRWLTEGVFESNPLLKQNVNTFIGSQYAYFSGTSFFENELSELYNLVNDAWAERFKYQFLKFKGLVE